MTASFRIVNTSNWDGENLRIKFEGREDEVLKPGEQFGASPNYGGKDTPVAIVLEQDGEKPFYLNGKEHKDDRGNTVSGHGQVFPYVISGVGSTPKVSQG